jgi:tetratricopeptide (TPR) repeat protein
MKKTLNVRYLLKLLVVLLVVGVGVHLLHARQADRQAEAFLHQADTAEKDGRFDRAAGYLGRYLALRPTETDVRARLGLALAKLARTAEQRLQAFLVLEQVLREDPRREDVRRKNINLAMDPRLQLYPEAKGHLQVLIDAHKDAPEGELFDLYGQSLAATGDYAEAEKAFAQATTLKPDLVLAYARRAALLKQRLNRPDVADKVIDDLLKNNGDRASAHLVSAAYWTGAAEAEKASQAVAAAQKIAPDDPEVILAAADLALARVAKLESESNTEGSRAALNEARDLLRRGVEKNASELQASPTAPESGVEETARRRLALVEMFRKLVAVEIRAGRLAEAEASARQGVEALPEQPELILALADVLIRRQELNKAGTELDRLEKAGYPSAVLDYHRGRMLAARGEWLESARRLERAVGDLVELPALTRQVYLLLGECYEHLGLLDRRYEAYSRARPTDPNDALWGPATVGMAAALAEMGRTAEAIQAYEQLAPRAPGAWLLVARLLMLDTLRQPPSARKWDRAEQALKRAPAGVEADLLQADFLAAKGELDDAREQVRKTRERHPDAIDAWVAAALVEARAGQPARAADLLGQTQAKFGDQIEVRLARLRFLLLQATPASSRELTQIADRLDHFTPADRQKLLRAVAETAQRMGASEAAALAWDRLAADAPDDLSVHLALFDRSLRSDDRSGALRALEEVRRIDGPSGSSARAVRALYLLWQARHGDQSGLDEASELLAGLERERPGWARVPLGQALIAELRGDIGTAIPKFRRAVDLGERDPDVVLRLVELLYHRQQYAEAEAVLRQLPEGGATLERARDLAAEVSLRSGERARALELATKAGFQDSTDYRKQLWLSRVLLLNQEYAKAERPLRRAVELAGTEPEPWVALVQYLVNAGRRAEAEKVVAEARSRLKKENAAAALAQCYETLGDLEAARGLYRQLLGERPDDVGVLRSVASFRLRTGDFAGTQELLERILAVQTKSREDADFARRLLAIVLAANPDYEKSRRALEVLGLVDQGIPTNPEAATPDETRARAVVMALQRDRRSKLEAVRLLEEVDARRHLDAEDQFLLAQLHQVTGDWPKARTRLAALVQTAADNPFYIAYYARGLIRQPDLAEAEVQVRQLETLQPDALRTAELRARLLAARGEADQARDLLLKQAERPSAPVAAIALLLEELNLGPAAEPLYKRVASESKRPEAVLTLATYYARQDRASEALDICERAWKTCNPEAVGAACAAVLYTAREPSSEQVRRVVGWLEAARQKAPASASLTTSLAAARNLQGDYAATMDLYRQALQQDAKEVVAMNNLAYLLSAREGKYAEALTYLERAKKAIGPLPTLLDTEATVRLAQGDAAAAVALLNDVLAQEPSATSYFHLAQAHLAANQRLDARLAWAKAAQLKLKPTDLHPLERSAYKEIERALAAN